MTVQLGISGHNIIAVYINRIKFDNHSEALNILEKNYARPEPRFVSVDARWVNQTQEVAMATSYADSAQARAWDRHFDEMGRPRPTHKDLFHDYDSLQAQAELMAEHRALEAERKKLMAIRISAAVDQIAEFWGLEAKKS